MQIQKEKSFSIMFCIEKGKEEAKKKGGGRQNLWRHTRTNPKRKEKMDDARCRHKVGSAAVGDTEACLP